MLTVGIYVYVLGVQPGIFQGRADFLDFLKLHSEREIQASNALIQHWNIFFRISEKGRRVFTSSSKFFREFKG